jgi:hypothetical protein
VKLKIQKENNDKDGLVENIQSCVGPIVVRAINKINDALRKPGNEKD